jgi:hypothetical protein
MNWLKATLGTVPFVYIGATYWQAEGILIGQAVGHVVFGLFTMGFVRWFFVKRCREGCGTSE